MDLLNSGNSGLSSFGSLHTIGDKPCYFGGQKVYNGLGMEVGRLHGRDLVGNYGFSSGSVRNDGAVLDSYGMVRDWLDRRPFPTIGRSSGLLGGSNSIFNR